MSRFLRAIVVLSLAALAVAAPRARAQQGLELNAMEMLDLYERRRDVALSGFGENLHADSVYSELTREGKKWVLAKGPKEADRRRMVMAAFVLEVVARLAADREQSVGEQEIRALARGSAPARAAGSGSPGYRLPIGAPPTNLSSAARGETEWGIAMRLVNWMRQQLVDQKTPPPLEIVWHQALVGLIEHYALKDTGAANVEIIGDMKIELEYLRDRYPKDPQFLLVWAWCGYWDYRPSDSMLWAEKMEFDHLWNTWDIPFLHSAEGFYTDALANASTAAEAKVRVAELRLKRGDPDGALTILQDVDSTSSDREIRYLSALEQGWAYDMKGNTAKAVESFRRALAFLPDAQTASVALAGAFMMDGRPDDASDIMDRSLAAQVLDPWLFHRYPAYEHFGDLMNRLRDELK